MFIRNSRVFSKTTAFSKNALKTNKFWKIQNSFLHFWWQFYIYGFSMVYCLFSFFQWLLIHRRKRLNFTAVKSHLATTVSFPKFNLNWPTDIPFYYINPILYAKQQNIQQMLNYMTISFIFPHLLLFQKIETYTDGHKSAYSSPFME